MTTQLSSYLYSECYGLQIPAQLVSQPDSTRARALAYTNNKQKIKKVLNMVAHACVPTTEDVEAKGS